MKFTPFAPEEKVFVALTTVVETAGLTVMVNVVGAVETPFAEAVTVIGKLPDALAVPDRTPVLLSVIPAGKVPVEVNVGLVRPTVVMLNVPAVPWSKVVEVLVMPALTTVIFRV